MRPLNERDLEFLQSKEKSFNDKVNYLKYLLRSPYKYQLVEKLPTLTTEVVKFSAVHLAKVKLLYCIQVLVEIEPKYKSYIDEFITEVKDFNDMNDTSLERLNSIGNQLRSLGSFVGLVFNAASRVFTTTEALAFDHFSKSLTPEE